MEMVTVEDVSTILKAISGLFDGEASQKSRRVKKALDTIKRLSEEAISLEQQGYSEFQRGEALMAQGDDAAFALSTQRRRTIHFDYCKNVHRISLECRAIVLTVLGRLAIDSTTVGTGLDEHDRNVVAQVSGLIERW